MPTAPDASPQVFTTPFTKLFGINHPISLAGMNVAAGPELAAAVSNAGGIGVIGGLGYTPSHLRSQIHALKAGLKSPDLPFGVDLLIPAVGKTPRGSEARKTNYDYTKGGLMDLIAVIIEEKTSLFVCAVGVPPPEAVKALHDARIVIMNMIGLPKHAKYAIEAGADILCAQGSEAGGHSQTVVPTALLVPRCIEIAKGHKSPLTGEPIMVLAAGGIHDGKGLASALIMGAAGVWVGTRFVASKEASAPDYHKKQILSADFEDVAPTLIYTGRPLRVRKTPYVADWEANRQDEIKQLTSAGIIPHEHELKSHPNKSLQGRSWLMGTVAGSIDSILTAKEIVDEMVTTAKESIQTVGAMAKL